MSTKTTKPVVFDTKIDDVPKGVLKELYWASSMLEAKFYAGKADVIASYLEVLGIKVAE